MRPSVPEPREYFCGVDLGQARDPSAIVVVERVAGPAGSVYVAGHVERIPLGTRYPAVVEHVGRLVRTLLAEETRPRVSLVVDRTGVGRAVGDLMEPTAVGAAPTFVTITGGDAVARDEDGAYRVPKRDLVGVVQATLQTARLRVAASDPLARELERELVGFRARVRLSGHVGFEAGEDWRSAPHDDLVLALALATWWGENEPAGWADVAAETDIRAFFGGR